VNAGEEVLDVPATLASRVRVLSTGHSNKNDPNDALSVAIAALRSPGLRSVEPANHTEVLRLLAKRNHEIGRLRNIVVSRLHAALANLSPGGIAKELNASDAVRLLGDFNPKTAVEQTRYDLALELLDDVRRLDVQLKESHKRIKTASARFWRVSSSATPAMSGGSPAGTSSLPMPEWLPSSCRREAGSSIG
jgi:hypothetical protein